MNDLIDITHNCEQELELQIQNNQVLYRLWDKAVRWNDWPTVDRVIRTVFSFREDQHAYLVEAFEEESTRNILEEYSAWCD
jgi:hypothetical protein